MKIEYRPTCKMVEGLINIITSFSVVIILLTSCSSDDDFSFDETKEGIYVLTIGNSLSNDVLSYVPFIIKELNTNTFVDFQILYKSGIPLSTHWEHINNNITDYALERCNTDASSWHVTGSVLGSRIISSRRWNLVILQQGSADAYSYEHTQPYVHNIVSYIREKNPSTPIAYMFCHSRKGYSTAALKGKTSDEVWEMQVNVAERLLKEGEVDYIIPCGTAIQNARHTPLKAFGEKGQLTYDGLHLQEGIPCMIGAYTAAQSLFDILSIDASIMNSNLQITQQWVYEKNILGQHGSVITGTDEDYELCKKCALYAVENPYKISMIP